MHIGREETCPIYLRKFTLTSVCLMDSNGERADPKTRKEVAALFS